jgi:hypothetical protein
MWALGRERDQRAAGREKLAEESAWRFHLDHCLCAHAELLHSCVAGDVQKQQQAA